MCALCMDQWGRCLSPGVNTCLYERWKGKDSFSSLRHGHVKVYVLRLLFIFIVFVLHNRTWKKKKQLSSLALSWMWAYVSHTAKVLWNERQQPSPGWVFSSRSQIWDVQRVHVMGRNFKKAWGWLPWSAPAVCTRSFFLFCFFLRYFRNTVWSKCLVTLVSLTGGQAHHERHFFSSKPRK